MIRKDYILIASVLRDALSEAGKYNDNPAPLVFAVNEFCAKLCRENPRFDEGRFKDFIKDSTAGPRRARFLGVCVTARNKP